MVIFNSYVTNYQRVYIIIHCIYGYRYYIMYILAHRNSKSLREK